MGKQFDVVVIGGGPGGTPAAMALAAAGKKVLLAEKTGKLGGACLFTGCIPSKIVRKAADDFRLQSGGKKSGETSGEDVEAVWSLTRKKMDRILQGRSNGALQKAKQLTNLAVIHGTAKFQSEYQVEVIEESGQSEIYDFKNALIAAGARSSVPPFKGSGVRDVLVSEDFFYQDKLPKSLVIIGGGPIGIELAQMLAKFGVKCTIIEVMETVLFGVTSPAFIRLLTKTLEEAGVTVYTSCKVLEINRNNAGFSTDFIAPDGTTRSVQSEQVLVAAGKAPNIESLNLGAAGIEFSKAGIITNEYLETTAKGVYAAGDVIQGPKFAHMATHEALIATQNILQGNCQKIDFAKNSWVLFTDPEFMSAGYSEEDAAKAGFDVVTGEYNYIIDAAAQVHGIASGILKFVVDKRTNIILGVQAIVPGADLIAGEAALIVAQKLTLQDVAQTVHPHPTLTEAFGFLALEMLRKR